jgi:phosphate/sulfate permease
MNKFAFITLSSILSGLSAAVLGGILGYLYSQFTPDHAHQIVPTWMILAVVGFIIAFVIGLISSIYHIYKKTANPSLLKIVIISSAISFLMNVVFVFLNFTR